MKALVVFHSLFGNTNTIASAIADEMAAQATVQLVPLDKLNAETLKDVDLLVVGTPTHNADIPPEVRTILIHLPKGCLKGVRAATFDTSLKFNWFVDLFNPAAPKLSNELRRLGAKPVGEPQSFWVSGKEGPLSAGEIERAKAWAKSLLIPKS